MSQEEEIKIKKKGSKNEVWEGKAVKTTGGLSKEDLMLNKKGKIVSIRMNQKGNSQIKNLNHQNSSEENGAAGAATLTSAQSASERLRGPNNEIKEEAEASFSTPIPVSPKHSRYKKAPAVINIVSK